MGFFDNVTSNLSSLKEKASGLAQTGVAKSKQLAEIAKLKTANIGEEDAIKKAYAEIGKLYYAEKGLAPEGAFAAACEKITAAKAAIEANNDRIAELKAELGPDAADPVEEVAELVEEAVAEGTEEAAEILGETAEEVVEEVAEAVAEETAE